jgi:hypothetical protein
MSSEIRSLGASVKPSGKIKTEPTFSPLLVPAAEICFTEVSYGILTTASNTVSGNTACGTSISTGFCAK